LDSQLAVLLLLLFFNFIVYIYFLHIKIEIFTR